MLRLSVAKDRRTLQTSDGQPFFWLGDTAWELLHRATREQIGAYLDKRRSQGFNVVQVVLVPEVNGLTLPNAYGHVPFERLDPTRPVEGWFELVDFLVEQAEARGLYVALLPTWGAYTITEKHPLFEDHAIFNEANATVYGTFLGRRYAARPNAVWVLGGDRPPETNRPLWRAMAAGIRSGCPSAILTYHPQGGHSSAEWLHDEPWLDFHMLQSGHSQKSRPEEMLANDWQLSPAKPVLNAEPMYEQIRNELDPTKPKLGADVVRPFWYRSVFAGSCGITYGANEVWMMWAPEHEPYTPVIEPPFLQAERHWLEALDYEGANQVRHLKTLFENRNLLGRRPSRHGDLLVLDGDGWRMAFVPAGAEIVLPAAPEEASLAWYDPRTGHSQPIAGHVPTQAPDARDWVLTIDLKIDSVPLR